MAKTLSVRLMRLLFTLMLLGVSACARSDADPSSAPPAAHAASAPPPNALENEVNYGEALIRRTYAIVGPQAANAAMRYSGNDLACGSCHLDGGRRAHGLSLIGVVEAYPRNMARENAVQSIEQRINGCFERSLNGRALPIDGREMKAMVAYLRTLRGVPAANVGELAAADIRLLERAADPARGASVYAARCASCHGADGQGRRNADALGYVYPPLWGGDSFNDGAGMHRIITAATFIRANMPYGTTYARPVLTDAEAFDVAAYINTQPRPHRNGLDRDYPDRSRKPVDAPFPPYADSLSQHQHAFGPWVSMTPLRTRD